MASQHSSSTSHDGQAKLLKMVNDQRARCKLTSLESVINQTGFNWVDSMIQHARDTYQDHISNAVSEAEMNVNILRSPKKDKQKQSKKTTTSKKASPFKKSRMPKASTPPRKSAKKTTSTASRLLSPTPSAPASKVLQESVTLQNNSIQQPLQSSELDLETSISKTKEKKTSSTLFTSQAISIAPVSLEVKALGLSEEVAKESTPRQDLVRKEPTEKVEKLKRKSQAGQLDASKRCKGESGATEESAKQKMVSETAPIAEEAKAVEPASSAVKVISIKDTQEEEATVAEKEVAVDANEDVQEEAEEEMHEVEEEALDGGNEVNETLVIDSDEELMQEEEEVSRVMVREVEIIEKVEDVHRAAMVLRKSEVTSKGELESIAAPVVEPPKKAKEVDLQPSQESAEESFSSLETKSLRSDDIFSEGEVEPAPPSSSSSTSAPKPSLRERIDRFRAIFSPAPRLASSIPRLSPPKVQSPPRPVPSSSISKQAPSQLNLLNRVHPAPKSPPKSPAKATSLKAATATSVAKAAVAQTPVSAAPVKHTPVVKVAPVPAPAPVSVTVSVPIKVTAPVALAPAASIKAAPTTSVKITAPASIKLTSQSKTVKVIHQHQQQQVPLPPVANINPFQKAQLQQQQAALATTSTLRAKELEQQQQQQQPNYPHKPLASTAHIELEEPDSAYSDSDDEETVKRRQQHKAWETKEGLAKALEEQAFIDADAIFGIPHGVVPIDDILPPETDHARAKRARPRSSSATWSRDGLKQVEIDRYNARMGIQGPGVQLPMAVQDDGSGTPSRLNRLSAIAQSAVTQGQISRKPSQSGALRASVSPLRPTSSTLRPGASSSQSKYPALVNGTPKPASKAGVSSVPHSSQKTKVSKAAGSGSVNKQVSSKTATKNPFQNGVTGTLQTGRLGVKASSTASEMKKKT